MENESLKSMCEELKNLNNELLTSKLKPKQVKTYVRTHLRSEAKSLRKLFNEEFKNIELINPLKSEVYFLLIKLGILKNIKMPTMEQIRENEQVDQYSTDELTEEEREPEETEGEPEEEREPKLTEEKETEGEGETVTEEKEGENNLNV